MLDLLDLVLVDLGDQVVATDAMHPCATLLYAPISCLATVARPAVEFPGLGKGVDLSQVDLGSRAISLGHAPKLQKST